MSSTSWEKERSSAEYKPYKPDELWDPAYDIDSLKQFFKTILFSLY